MVPLPVPAGLFPTACPSPAQARQDNRLVGALQNGLAVLDLFGLDRQTITIGEIAIHLGLHKSSASRIVATLVASGFLRPSSSSTGYRLGGKMTRLGAIAAADTNLSTVALPTVRILVDELGETCHVGVLDGREAVTVALVDGWHAVRLHSWVGKRSQAHCTAMGKVLLAGLPESTLDLLYPTEDLPAETEHSVSNRTAIKNELAMIRRHGFALDNEELEIGLRCVAAPVFDHTGHVIAGLTIAGSTSRLKTSDIETFATQVRFAARKISSDLGAPANAGTWELAAG